MSAAEEIAHAKINLALHVRRRRGDGFHEIETLFAFAEGGDRLTLAPADDWSLTIEGEFGEGLSDGEDNLVLRAARAFAQAFGGAHGRFGLDKRLPVAAGVGGGSADAAAALRMLARAANVPLNDPALDGIARRLGADVPACLASVPVRGDVRGDILSPVDGLGLTGTPLLLVNPRVPLATAPVFAGWDEVDRGALADGDPLAVAGAGRNDLEPSARALVPAIGEVVALLATQPGVTLARMSGSGATCFALFGDEATRDAASHAVATSRPNWWRLATRLR